MTPCTATCANVEIGAFLAECERHGVLLSWFREKVQEDGWRMLGKKAKGSASYAHTLLCDKMYEADMYQGDAAATRTVLYLLAYYAQQLKDAWTEAAVVASFLALKTAWTHCVAAALVPGPLTRDDVAAWHAAQLEHQRLFVLAHSLRLVPSPPPPLAGALTFARLRARLLRT